MSVLGGLNELTGLRKSQQEELSKQVTWKQESGVGTSNKDGPLHSNLKRNV